MDFNAVQVILFDWGNTLMRDDAGTPGPMCDWPTVEAVDGAAEALAGLQVHYRLALASNAQDSGAAQARAALQRVHLDSFFDAVFTSREVGAQKPDPLFFQRVLTTLGCAPKQALMVGDGYGVDVLGAQRAGMASVWFNPQRKACPALHPVHQLELADLRALPEALMHPGLPELETCYTWLMEQGASEHLVRHCQAVAAVAFHLAERLRQKNVPVDPLLAHRGGLLHDLDKLTAAQAGLEHGQYAAQLLTERGQPQLAEIARRHLISCRISETWEQKLVFYADKVVEGDRFVGLLQRLTALSARYPQYLDDFIQARPRVLVLEAEVCQQLECSLPELYRDLQGLF